jgi:vacuolar-type H+-ATPase subunit E/Vma4
VAALPSFMLTEPAKQLGLISPETAAVPTNIGRTAGRFLGETAAQSIKTPADLGVTVATAAVSPYIKPVMGATGAVKASPFITNLLKLGSAGAVGSASGSLMFGEPFDPGRTVQEFTIAASTGVAQNVISLWINKFLAPHKQADFAKGVVDVIKNRYPALANSPDLMNIAANNETVLSFLAQKGSSALRENIDDTARNMTKRILNTIDRELTKSERATLREGMKSIINTQNKQLDSVLNKENQIEAYNAVVDAANNVRKFISDLPGEKNTRALEKFDEVLRAAKTAFDNTMHGAEIIGYLKESGAGGKLDLMKFAQLIRGEYLDPSNPLLNQVGSILGGGRPLTQMPLPGEREQGSELGRYAFNTLKNFIPIVRNMEALPYRAGQVPWPAPTTTPFSSAARSAGAPGVIQPLGDFSINAAGQAAIKNFMRERSSKE